VFLTKISGNLFAMKIINKTDNIDKFITDIDKTQLFKKISYDYKGYFNELLLEKEIGMMGNKCRFLVKLINSFQSEVKIIYI